MRFGAGAERLSILRAKLLPLACATVLLFKVSDLSARSGEISLILGVPVPVRVLGFRGDSRGFSYKWLIGFDGSVRMSIVSKLGAFLSFFDCWAKGDSSVGAGLLTYMSIAGGLDGRLEKRRFVFRAGLAPCVVKLSLDVGGTDHLDLWMYGVQMRSYLGYVVINKLEVGIGFVFQFLSKPWNRATYFNKPLGTSWLGVGGISVWWRFI